MEGPETVGGHDYPGSTSKRSVSRSAVWAGALIRYSEDWVAAAQSRFDVFLVNVPVGPMVFTQSERLPRDKFPPIMDWQGVLEQMITALGDPEKLWVYLPGPFSSTFSDVRMCCESRMGRNGKLTLPKGVGRIFGSTFP
jgi:hypothetical protein